MSVNEPIWERLKREDVLSGSNEIVGKETEKGNMTYKACLCL